MAQSRMAGIAMGLGPDDLADVGEAATLATNKMGMEHGQQASVLVTPSATHQYNDGVPEVTVMRGATGYSFRDPMAANPIDSIDVERKGFFGGSPNVNNAVTTSENNMRERANIQKSIRERGSYIPNAGDKYREGGERFRLKKGENNRGFNSMFDRIM